MLSTSRRIVLANDVRQRMRILFDGFWWHEGPAANRTVQRELVLAWHRGFPDDEVVVALRRGADDTDLPMSVRRVRTTLWPHAAANRWQLPGLARRVRADVTIAHNYTPVRGRSLVFIHDVMFEEHPEWFSRAELAYFSPMLRWARSAAIVGASTQTEAARIRRHAPSLPAPVVTGLGPPSGLHGERCRPAAVPEGTDFAVTVGRLNVRKNLETVMLAVAHSHRITPTSPLYVVGGTAHSGRGSSIPAAAAPFLEDGSIVLVGGVTDAELAWLYANASLSIVLSLDEGFGMPAVEAAAFGSPLLVSDIPVFRETVSDVAHLVAPLDEVAVGAAIDAAWGVRPDDALRQRAIGEYTWDAAAAVLRAAIA